MKRIQKQKETVMTEAHQNCRVCGVEIASGFTNCDACYHHDAFPAKAGSKRETMKGAKKP